MKKEENIICNIEVCKEIIVAAIDSAKEVERQRILQIINEIKHNADAMYDCSAQNTDDFILITELKKKIKENK